MRNLIAMSVLLALTGVPDAVHACSCKERPSPQSARDSADAVFTGLVTGISLGTEWIAAGAKRPTDCRTMVGGDKDQVALCEQANVSVRMQVFKAWKGDLQREEVVLTDSQGPACGVSFHVGQIFLVYAGRDAAGILRTSLCTRTASIDKAQEDIDALGQPEHDAFSQPIQNGESKR
jgi:hypothetical protein